MSLYYSLVFGILIIETFIFALLAVPLPMVVRRPLTKGLAQPFLSPTVQVIIKVILGFILLLFVDTVNRMYTINMEYERSKGAGYAHDRLEILSRKFLAQRNMYLTGITLFLTFTIVRTFGLVLELFDLKDKCSERNLLPGSAAAATKSGGKGEKEQQLSREIRELDEQISLLKEQSEALAKNM
ncbi:Yet3p Ecym_3255 [Eremothecium cymbalariae DBVPG|uniref:Endoplasmic reticulum transmembrane protein n=1 Tax=Eremothecium cymbalariae (strain CBS 270.75 / DBVPG 7215 / KCTC 17166 / NRRL Y-17582) TaxID=931890 RepID=G8JRH9_ERECY|nr:Hypothetical protein Ecym_3255 [Eremothecium cymbalariae DBVPG\